MSISITATVGQEVNFAAIKCGRPLIKDIRLSGGNGSSVICKITSSPAVFCEYEKEIAVGVSAIITTVDLITDDAFWRSELVEARDGEIKIQVLDKNDRETVLGSVSYPVHVQPYLHWNHNMAATMPAFMQPNDPLVTALLQKAGEHAKKLGISLNGYQGGDPNQVKLQAKALYMALIDENIHYISYPPSYEFSGQKIRIPHMVLHDTAKQGTCLDLAVLMATGLETLGLHPCLIVIRGHAFAAVFMDPSTSFSSSYCLDGAEVSRLAEEGKLLAIECTTFTGGPEKAAPFEVALSSGARNIKVCEYAFDVEKSRNNGIVPAFTFTDKPICVGDESKDKEDVKENEDSATSSTSNIDEEDVTPNTTGTEQGFKPIHTAKRPERKLTKYDRLKILAIDLTAKNALIAKKKDSDILSFSLDSKKFFVGEYSDDSIFDSLVKKAILNKKEGSQVSKKELDKSLRQLFIRDRVTKRERKKSNLYIAVDELHWCKEDGTMYKAPLYLYPIEIYKNCQGEHMVRTVEDKEIILNPVLKELLLQCFDIDISAIEASSNENKHNRYDYQLDVLNYCIEKQDKWKIVKNIATIGVFTVPNEAILRALEDLKDTNHPVVKSIFEENLKEENDLANAETKEEYFDNVYAFQADHSQATVVKAAGSKHRAQVVIGPAGNGKSQTVANILTEAYLAGKKVLFVSEKIAAISVIQSLLDQAGVGKFCLSAIEGVHTNRTFLNQIQNTLSFIESYDNWNLNSNLDISGYEVTAEKLAVFYDELRKTRSCGKSLVELMNEYEEYRDIPFELEWRNVGDAINNPNVIDLLYRYESALEICGVIREQYLNYVNNDVTDTRKLKELKEYAQQTIQKYEELDKLACSFIINFGLSTDSLNSKEIIGRAYDFAALVSNCPIVGESFDLVDKIGKNSLEEIKSDLLETLTEMRSHEVKTRPYKHAQSILLDKLGDVSREVRNNCKKIINDPDSLKNVISGISLADFSEVKRIALVGGQQNLDKIDLYSEYQHYRKNSNIRLLDEYNKNERECALKILDDVAQGINSTVYEESVDIQKCMNAYGELFDKVAPYVLRNEDEFNNSYPDEPKVVLLKAWLTLQEHTNDYAAYQRIQEEADEINVGKLFRQIDAMLQITADEKIDTSIVRKAYFKALCEYNISKVEEEIPEIQNYNYIWHNAQLKRYMESEQTLREGLRNTILSTHMGRVPNMEAGVYGNVEFTRLNEAIRKGTPPSIRSVFEKSPNVLLQMYPCMLMNPEAVAEYVPDEMKFDLVIIDEGSQMPTYKAVIALAKGDCAMVFGDEAQLCPSDFFQHIMEDETGEKIMIDSILSDFCSIGAPRKMLKMHYRAETESLIAFSNHRYYNGNIITFPSKDTSVQGVEYHYIEDACYERGGKRVNKEEAKFVVDYVIDLYENKLSKNTKETVGIVTTNLAQKNLIQSMLLERTGYGTELEHSIGRAIDELVTVVNLEGCQGKEWDYVILSFAYGPAEDGSFMNNFGPITSSGGSNRLNVMFTRARKKMVAVTSFTPEMITTESEGGNKDLKDFLLYARGDLKFDKRSTDTKSAKGIAAKVISTLEDNGYSVHTNVGSSKCKVDIAVVSRNNPDEYELGILLDHFDDSRYHVKDQEIICPQILKKKGWNIYRLHSINFNEHPELELRNILACLNREV